VVNQTLKPLFANRCSSQTVGLTAIKTASIAIEARIGSRAILSAVHTAPILSDIRCTHCLCSSLRALTIARVVKVESINLNRNVAFVDG
jgi:hypothetical protein